MRQVAGESIHVCMSLMSRQMMTLHVDYIYCKVVEWSASFGSRVTGC